MEEEKELKDIKWGASFAYEGVIYECRPAYTCEGCYFGRKPCDEEEKGRCVADSRSDGENVIFVEVKPENKER